MSKVPGMYDTLSEIDGVVVECSAINEKRTDEEDTVFVILDEEQGGLWRCTKRHVLAVLKSVAGSIDCLDVGCGSGIFGILVGKHGKTDKIVSIDVSRRAIEFTKRNATRNGVRLTTRHEFYNLNSAPYRSCKVIGINAPYHPGPVQEKLPQHARGGVDGQQVFREELVVADYHLAEGGIIAFHQMCLGREGQPEFVRCIPHLVREASLTYTNVLPPTSTAQFLRAVYGSRFRGYQRETAKAFPELYLCNGIIRRDGRSGKITRADHNLDLRGRTWQDRFALHREIAKHGL